MHVFRLLSSGIGQAEATRRTSAQACEAACLADSRYGSEDTEMSQCSGSTQQRRGRSRSSKTELDISWPLFVIIWLPFAHVLLISKVCWWLHVVARDEVAVVAGVGAVVTAVVSAGI